MTGDISKEDAKIIELFLDRDKLRKFIEETRKKLGVLEVMDSYIHGENEMTNKEMRKALYELLLESEEYEAWKLKN